MKKINFLICVIAAAVLACSCEDNTGEYIDYCYNNAQKSAAIKGCLTSAADTASAHLFVSNGFMGNENYKIDYAPLQNSVFSVLAQQGMGNMADSLIWSTNRMAESCRSVVSSVLKNTIKELTVTNYDELLYGDSTAITDYYAMLKYMALRDSLQSPVEIRMNVFSVNSWWSSILTQYNAHSTTPISFDVRNYIIDQMLKGVFEEMRLEEQKIRVDTNHQDENTALFRNLRK